MIGDTMKKIYCKGNDIDYPVGVILLTNTGLYKIDMRGFYKLDNDDLSDYTEFPESVAGTTILEAWSNGMEIYIRLSEDNFIVYTASGLEGLELDVNRNEEFKSSYEYVLERDSGMQQLSLTHPTYVRN